MTRSYIWYLFALMLVLLAFSRCAHRQQEAVGENSAAYKAVCHGPPLHNIEDRAKAMREGYAVHPSFSCIEKASYEAVTQQNAEEAAARTPEGIARRKAEQERRIEEHERQMERQQRQREETTPVSPPPRETSVRLVDINSATESELANIVGATTAATILSERQQRPFSGWADVVRRVVGLSAAQTAARASFSGLTVNGESLSGAPPQVETNN